MFQISSELDPLYDDTTYKTNMQLLQFTFPLFPFKFFKTNLFVLPFHFFLHSHQFLTSTKNKWTSDCQIKWDFSQFHTLQVESVTAMCCMYNK